MSKRTSGGVVKSDNINKLVYSFEQLITSADTIGCAHIQSKLEHLLKLTKERREELEDKAQKEGLNYKGEDEVKCGCGNTFQSSGEYAVVCDGCAEKKDDVPERCKECVKECATCGVNLCSDCQITCSGCDDQFCKDCLQVCNGCHEGFCDRNKDCALVGADYGGGSSCVYCLER